MNHFPARVTLRCALGVVFSITLGCAALPLNRPAAPVFDPQPGSDACPRVVTLKGVPPSTQVQAIAYAANGMASEVVSGALNCTPASLSRATFAASLRQAFALPVPVERVPFVDVPPGDPAYGAVQAIAPYLHRKVLCPGCRLSLNYLPADAPSRLEAAITIVSLLIERRGVVLMSDAQATLALKGVPDAAALNSLARRFVATAIAQGVLSLDEKGRVRGADVFVMSDLSTVLGALDRKARAQREQSK